MFHQQWWLWLFLIVSIIIDVRGSVESVLSRVVSLGSHNTIYFAQFPL